MHRIVMALVCSAVWVHFSAASPDVERQGSSPPTPGPRWGHAMAYDEARDRVVVFGGQRDRETALHDTWLWDGRQWSRIAGPAPAPRSYASMAYDRRRARIVLYGGREYLKAPPAIPGSGTAPSGSSSTRQDRQHATIMRPLGTRSPAGWSCLAATMAVE